MARKRHAEVDQNGTVKWRHLSVGTWIAIASFGLTLLGGSVAVLARYFPSIERVDELEKAAAVEDTRHEHTDWQVQMLWVEQQNTKAKVDRTDKNVERMMVKMQLDPAPEAVTLPLPAPPLSHAAKPTR